MSNKFFKYIPNGISNFQADVDKERTSLSWDEPHKSLSLRALTVDQGSGIIGLAADLSTDSSDFLTFTTAVTGISSSTESYVGDSIIFLSGNNIITRPKIVESYNGTGEFTFSDPVETIPASGDKFSFSSVAQLIDDTNIYVNSTITYGTSGSNKITSYNSTTKTFEVSGALTLEAGDSFIVEASYYPKLTTSIDGGKTFSSVTNLTFEVDTDSSPISINGGNYYNTIKTTLSSLLDLNYQNFYIGGMLTFITGTNKGTARQINTFDKNTFEFTTDYFEYPILASDVFTINLHLLPLNTDIEDSVFKIVLWNNNEGNPIEGLSSVAYPSFSLKNYSDTLDNNYWDISTNKDVYKVIQSINHGGHAKAELENKFQNLDFSIEQVRNDKIYTNFGKNFNLNKNPSSDWDRYHRRILDIAQAFRVSGTYESLYHLCRAFNQLTPSVAFLSKDGWRLGNNRLGSPKTLTDTIVVSGDYSAPYNTFTTSSSGLGGDYTGDYMTFTNVPSGSMFDISILGKFIPITAYTPGVSGSDAEFAIDTTGTIIPSGANVSIYSSALTNYGTIPYSDLAYLFGVRLYMYGPYLDDVDQADFSRLLEQIMPLHIRYFTIYETGFFGDSSLAHFNGTKTALLDDYSVTTLKPDKDNILEPHSRRDILTMNVGVVTDTANTFAVSGATFNYDFYKDTTISFTTGNNAGISKSVTNYIGGLNTFVTEDFPYVIQVGDTFKIEVIDYQTKYVTESIDLGVTTFFDNLYSGGWFVRKVDPDIEEKVYAEFSDDNITFTTARELFQNEGLNTLTAITAASSGSTSTFSASGVSALSAIDEYYTAGYIKCIAGSNLDEIKQITAYIGSSATFTTDSFTNPITANDEFTVVVTDLKRYCRLILYHDYIYKDTDIEIESLIIKKL